MQIKHIAAVLCMVCSASASGAERLSVAAMPEPVRPLAVRVVSRGAESLRVDCKVAVDAFILRIR